MNFNFLSLGLVLGVTRAIALAPTSGRAPYPILNATESLPTSNVSCTSPSLRQEWSSVTQDVRDNYITATLCFTSKSSRIGLNSTFYDDFPWAHNQLAGESQFLPFLITYVAENLQFILLQHSCHGTVILSTCTRKHCENVDTLEIYCTFSTLHEFYD